MFKEIIIRHRTEGKVDFHFHLKLVTKISFRLKQGLKYLKTKLGENESKY